MRPLTPEAAQAILARETGEAFLALMQISGPVDPEDRRQPDGRKIG